MSVILVIDVIYKDDIIVPVKEEVLYEITRKPVDPKGKGERKK